MDVSTLSPFRLEFLRRAEWRREDDRKVQERELKARKDKEEREKKADREDRIEEVLFAVMVTDQEIADFTVTLDTYDAATIEALQKNEEALVKVREELSRMLDKAYVLPDGRRVFKTEDGLHVFDEHGVEVKGLDPDEIEEWRPKWDRFTKELAAESDLIQEQEQIFDYQAKLDDARERAEDTEHPLTHDELEELKAKLEKSKPDAVKRVLGEDTVPAPTSEQDFDPSTLTLRKPQLPTLGS